MSHLPALPPRVPPEVPLGADILCLGEAPGKKESDFGRPFIGASGQLLRWALHQVGFQKERVAYANVLPFRPPDNNLTAFCVSKVELRNVECPDWYRALPNTVPGQIIHPGLGVPALEELHELIRTMRPRIIISLGNTACWATLHQTGIEKLRGAPYWSARADRDGMASKVLATYHPAAVIRNYKQLTVFQLDLLKALNESETAGIVWPERWLEIATSPGQIAAWLGAMAAPGSPLPAVNGCPPTAMPGHSTAFVACDVETERKPGPNITLIGFAPVPHLGLVIPFINPLAADRCYFSREDEKQVILLIKAFMENPSVRKCWHNCLYDLPWIHSYGINPQNAYFDTMLMSHALWPEMRKSLRLLGSILTNERNWKFLRTKSNKRED